MITAFFDRLSAASIYKLGSQTLGLQSTLQYLLLHDFQVELLCPTQEVTLLFDDNPLLPGVILTDQEQFVGMISRQRFFEHMIRPYSLDLFARRPIKNLYKLTCTEFLILPSNTSIVAAAQQSLQRLPELLYEPIVVQMETGDYKILDTYQLLLANSQIHQLTIDALRESQKTLFSEKELAQVTLQSLGDAVITTDELGRIQSLNPVAEKLTGWQTHEAINLPLTKVFKIINETTRKPVKNPIEIVLKEGMIIGLDKHTILIARDGREFIIKNSAAPIHARDNQIIGVVLVFHDITQERQLAKQVSWQASHDALTGLVNRREFEQQLEQALSSARSQNQQHTLCYLDLDRFKIVNDTCGHIAGDELLRQIAFLWQNHVRKADILGRIGGDEFGLLLHQCSLEQARRIANVLRDLIQEFRFCWQDKTFTIGVSIGLTAITAQTQNSASILSAADAACYVAKNNGRNRVHIYQAEDSELARQQSDVEWIGRITQALAENHFRLYYQAIAPIHAHGRLWEHYEVLVRLVDETGKIVSPMAFIPTAERYDLMPAIDRWIVSTLFASQREHYQKMWRRYTKSVTQGSQLMNYDSQCLYAINLSGASINDDQFIDFLHKQFALYQIPPQVICFEITETVAITNMSKANQFIKSLKELGCRFALDDFGSGMSSFTYLKNLPVDYLKIDGSFVKDIVTDPISGAMVEAINRIGQVMGIQTIAEFVENDAILTKLKAMGVNYAQGHGIAEPRPLIL